MTASVLDWRRRVAAMYAAVRARADADPEGTLAGFRAERDRLFREHPDSPIPPAGRTALDGLPYWPYEPTLRFVVPVEPEADSAGLVGPSSITCDSFELRGIGRVRLPFGDLEVYWVDVYGGGVFLPFRDGTSGSETYGACRYLLDTIKGADLGGDAGGLVLDFNYPYHPSCAYDPVWSCPLAPRELAGRADPGGRAACMSKRRCYRRCASR